jgi:hypothetical protein
LIILGAIAAASSATIASTPIISMSENPAHECDRAPGTHDWALTGENASVPAAPFPFAGIFAGNPRNPRNPRSAVFLLFTASML